MERSGPRIYVPLAMPDTSNQHTYAVLEFVGFSASPTPHHLLPQATMIPPAPTPSMLCLPPAPSSSQPASYLPLPLTPPVHPRHTFLPPPPNLSLPHFPDNRAFFIGSPPRLLPPNPHSHLGSSLEVIHLESPPSSPSSLAPSIASTASRDSSREKNPHYPNNTDLVKAMGSSHLVSPVGSSKPNGNFSSASQGASSNELNRSMVSFNSAHGMNKPMVNYSSAEGSLIPSSDGDAMETRICVSQTDRETIVHTHSSNFRDVVRQLTGASSDDQDLMPVTLPARLANRVSTHSAVGVNAEGPGGAGAAAASMRTGPDQLGLRKAPLKLHERRKSSMKNLEKITTAFTQYATELSPANPSPVTPLASDFERFCNASTPTSQGSSGLNSPINLISKVKNAMEVPSTGASSGKEREMDQTPVPPRASLERASPTLLNLFPESPGHSLASCPR